MRCPIFDLTGYLRNANLSGQTEAKSRKRTKTLKVIAAKAAIFNKQYSHYLIRIVVSKWTQICNCQPKANTKASIGVSSNLRKIAAFVAMTVSSKFKTFAPISFFEFKLIWQAQVSTTAFNNVGYRLGDSLQANLLSLPTFQFCVV